MRETAHTITQTALSILMIIGGATPLGLALSRRTAPDLRSCRYSDRVFLSKWSRAAFHDNAMAPGNQNVGAPNMGESDTGDCRSRSQVGNG
jgi:hypothetical protein